ncbi:MAG: hypothetical protein ACE5JJ_06100 [Nitrospinota bacterium]
MTTATTRRKKGVEGVRGEKAVRRKALTRRPTREQVEAECQKILELWAAGMGDSEARQLVGLTEAQYLSRVYRIAQAEWGSREGVWPKFLARAMARYRDYQRVYRLAMESTPSARLKVALAALMAMSALDRDIIEVGQRLGVYPRAAEPEGEGPELAFRTLILEAARRAESARLPQGKAEVFLGQPRALPEGSKEEVEEKAGPEADDREGG